MPMQFALHDHSCTLLLWRMTEDEERLLGLFPELKSLSSEYETFKSPSRRLEYLSVRALLCSHFGYVPIVGHTAEGRPYLDGGMNISISHTKGFCTVILSAERNVAVDIEYRSGRVMRIAGRFLREDEKPTSLDGHLAAWCAKETLYKLHSSDRLGFAEMRVKVLDEDRTGEKPVAGKLLVENLRRAAAVEVNYLATEDYILTYAAE